MARSACELGAPSHPPVTGPRQHPATPRVGDTWAKRPFSLNDLEGRVVRLIDTRAPPARISQIVGQSGGYSSSCLRGTGFPRQKLCFAMSVRRRRLPQCAIGKVHYPWTGGRTLSTQKPVTHPIKLPRRNLRPGDTWAYPPPPAGWLLRTEAGVELTHPHGREHFRGRRCEALQGDTDDLG